MLLYSAYPPQKGSSWLNIHSRYDFENNFMIKSNLFLSNDLIPSS